jgi:hypothetical protein
MSITRRPFLKGIAAAAVLAGSLLAASCESLGMSASTPPSPEVGLYEVRTYTTSPGKMDALDARFRDHTIELFRRHGMTPIAFFHVAPAADGKADNRLVYIMGYKDRAARDAAWKDFSADPEWTKVYQESESHGALLTKAPDNIFLTASDYSPKLDTRSASAPRFFELRTYTANPGKLEDLHSRFRDHTLTIFARHGMTNMLYWRPTGGQPQMENKLVYLLAFPSLEARTEAFQKFSADPEWQKVSQASNANGPLLAQKDGVVAVQLIPTDYSPLK